MNTGIKPCPFCKSMPTPKQVGQNKEYIIYQCQNCTRTPLKLSDARTTIRGAKRAWNKNVSGEEK